MQQVGLQCPIKPGRHSFSFREKVPDTMPVVSTEVVNSDTNDSNMRILFCTPQGEFYAEVHFTSEDKEEIACVKFTILV